MTSSRSTRRRKKAGRGGFAAVRTADRRRAPLHQYERRSGTGIFSDGISEDIITAMSKLRWFFVIALNSSITYKGNAVHLKQIAEELGVRYVVEGSARKVGDLVRITAQLNDTTTGSHIWAEHYDRDLTDGFAVQDEKIYLAENFRARRKSPNSLDAWGPVMRDWYGGTNRIRCGRSG